MNEERKELLLKDLCGRLPYGVKVQSTFYDCNGTIWKHENEILTIGLLQYPIERYKPYLFPLSSMTEEQKVIYGDLCYQIIGANPFEIQNYLNELYNWLNKNHFDYRGLIPMGLAIDCTNLYVY